MVYTRRIVEWDRVADVIVTPSMQVLYWQEKPTKK